LFDERPLPIAGLFAPATNSSLANGLAQFGFSFEFPILVEGGDTEDQNVDHQSCLAINMII
jgi:hypothetical protein